MAVRVAKRKYFKNIPVERVAEYATTLIRYIREHFGGVVSFTRDDVGRLPVPQFDEVAFCTRYRATCVAISYLIQKGELVRKKFPDLCLPENAASYTFDDTSAADAYAPTIKRLVITMPKNEVFAISHIVSKWRTDPELTLDTKRKAVRVGIRPLVRDGFCKQLNRFEFKVGNQP